ncbi:hypothetical protein CsSME_00047878 [Camellia sinensis var. sinensis]|uniref:nuclear speckle splicing regulatory protein 1-like n=1 Tax=Camellia sinensis TaxID=4442 RepID=UPI0010362ABB|nr:nuclear speckle splicing regulatory protein 1-like [Camellia sinensis]
MSRREARESDSKRHRSKFDREPSPKRSRRDGKPATERPSSNLNLDVGDHSDRDQKHRRRLQDVLPLEAPPALDSKVETGAGNKEIDKKTNGQHEGTKNSSNPTEASRSRSYFQHNERGNAGQAGRTTSRGTTTERGWRDSKDQHSDRATEKTTPRDTEKKDEKSQARGSANRVWRHDYEVEAGQQPPVRKRPSFREKKIEVNSENTDKVRTEPVKPSRPDRPLLESEKREERGGHNPLEKPFVRDGEANRGEAPRGSFPSRDRYGGSGSSYRGRERSNGGRRGYHPSGGVRVEKWKHDLYEEANRSPTPKNEEDQIAKVEALLSS